MANWWEKGAFTQPGVSPEEIDVLASEQAAPSVLWMDRLREAEWRGMVILAAVALLVVAVRGFDLWRGRQLISETQRNELRQTIAAELTARREGHSEAYLMLLDPLASQEWSQTQVATLTTLPLPIPGEEPPIIERWQFLGDTAMVDLWYAGPPASRETRFYRIVDDNWHRTPPVATFWGSRQEADAPGVHFVYREADADAVQGAIEVLRTAHRQGDLSVLAGERLIVEIVPDDIVEYEAHDNRLTLPSPRLSPRLVSVPDSAPILWRLAHPIADRLSDPGDAARYRYLDSVQLFQDHLRYWPLQWQAPFPERWEIQMLNALRAARDEDRLIAPRAINMFSASRSQSYLAYYEVMTVADYVAEQYGSAKLLALDQALAQASSWDRAVPAALGVDIGEFERGWRAYLDARLAQPSVTPPRPTPTVSG
ncbi:MAG: peptidase MA family metallohydrolase [Anaerolineae bacterium]